MKTPEKLRWYGPWLVWTLTILVLTSLPKIELPKTGFSMMDKVAHAGVYFILGFLSARARMRGDTQNLGDAIKFTAIFGTAFAIFDEVHQIFIPNRIGDVGDAAADIVGILLSLLVFKYLFVPIYKRKTWRLL